MKVLTVPSPIPLLTANQNLLKNSCLQQRSPPHQTPFFSSAMTTIIFFTSVLDKRNPRILLRSVWKTTCKFQNTYDGEPFDFIFNQWNVFSGIVDWTFCFDYIYNNVLFVRYRECDKKVVPSGSERRKTKNEAAISFWWYCKA